MGNHNGRQRRSSKRPSRENLTPSNEKLSSSCAAAVQETSGSEAAISRPTLTDQEKCLLQKTWRTLESDPISVGIITFSKFFEAKPEALEMFNAFRELDPKNMEKSQEMKQHAARVMGFVNKVIARLDDDQKYLKLMEELGQRHGTYGALPELVELMGDQFISVIQPSLEDAGTWNSETDQAWRKLFEIITTFVPDAN